MQRGEHRRPCETSCVSDRISGAIDSRDTPSEDDRGDLVERDECRLLRNEQQLTLEEVQLALVRLEVALDRRLAVVAVSRLRRA